MRTRSTAIAIAVALAIAASVTIAGADASRRHARAVERSLKTIPPPALEALRRSLREASRLLPAPEAPYRIHDEKTKLDLSPRAPWDPGSKIWARPARATARYYFDVPDEAHDLTAELRDLLGPIEVTIELNGEARFADLASEGDPPVLLPLVGLTAVEVTTVTPGAVRARVAAMTSRQSEYQLAAITIFAGDPRAEADIRDAVKTKASPHLAASPTSDPAEVQLIRIQIHGPRKPAEALARRIPAASLRRLLRR